MQHTGQMRQNKSKKSLLRTGLRLMLAAIIIPLAASLLLFFGFVSRQMRTQAEHMTQYYTDQLVNPRPMRSVRRRVSFISRLAAIPCNRSCTAVKTRSAHRPSWYSRKSVGQPLFNAAWDDQYVHSIFLCRQDASLFRPRAAVSIRLSMAVWKRYFVCFPTATRPSR